MCTLRNIQYAFSLLLLFMYLFIYLFHVPKKRVTGKCSSNYLPRLHALGPSLRNVATYSSSRNLGVVSEETGVCI